MDTEKRPSQRAIIYVRISQDRQGEGLGIQRQEEHCRAFAEREGFEVVDVLADNDVSGYSGKPRPGFTALRGHIAAREVDIVIAWKQDRLTRRQVEFWQLLEDAEPKGKGDAGVAIFTADGVRLDAATASGELTASMGIMMARYESSMKRERAISKTRQKAKAGEWLGGTRPFGWDVEGRQLVRNEREAAAVEAACLDLLAGRSLGSIVRDWNDKARLGGPLLTSLGKPWGYTQLRQVLTRERNTGRVAVTVGKGEPPVIMECPPLVTELIHGQVVALLSDKSRRRSQSNKARYLLAGIAQCQCGEPVKSATATGRRNKVTGEVPKRTVYRCPAKGPGHVAKGIEYVDTIAELFVFQLLARDAEAHAQDPARVEQLRTLDAQWQVLQGRKNQAGKLFAEGIMDAGQLAEFNRRIASEMAGVEAERERLGAASPTPLGDASEALRKFSIEDEAFRAWRRSPVDDRRDFMRSRLHVVLRSHARTSSRTFDTDTVSVYPRTLAERGRTLTADEVAARPLTPLVAGPNVGDADAGESWTEYLTAFMWKTGAGWPRMFESDPEHRDGRATFRPNWKPLA